MRGQKGITLVALIITIVVLLILSVVAISSVTNEGIINHANNAVTKFNANATAENQMLQNYEGTMNNLMNRYK